MESNHVSFLENHADAIGLFEGISVDQIEDIENRFDLKLPLAYKQYLIKYGKKSGSLLNGYYMNYPDLLDNKEDATYELNFDDRKKERVKLEHDYFFFAQWQGYNFFFFKCDEDIDNPPVFLFDTENIKKYKDSFTDFLKDEGLTPLLSSVS